MPPNGTLKTARYGTVTVVADADAGVKSGAGVRDLDQRRRLHRGRGHRGAVLGHVDHRVLARLHDVLQALAADGGVEVDLAEVRQLRLGAADEGPLQDPLDLVLHAGGVPRRAEVGPPGVGAL